MVGDSVPYSPAMTLDPLRRAAEARGVATRFTDAAGRDRRVSEATLRAVLAAMGEEPDPSGAPDSSDSPGHLLGVPRTPPDRPGHPLGVPRTPPRWPPVVVARVGRPHAWRPPPGARAGVVLETGEERPLPERLPGDLPPGRHRVEGRDGSTALVVAPGRCHLPAELAAGGRAWGWAVQLYALCSRASWGIGDLADLAGLLAATAPLGAGFALVNPLHAAGPAEASPYNPSSRVFRNPLYLRVEAVPELGALPPDARARVEELARQGRGLLDRGRIDRPAVARLKDEALRLVHAALPRLPARRAGLAAYRAATPGLDDYAAFCALQRAHGQDWRAWPAAYRHPGQAEVARFRDGHRDEVAYHAWLQWLLDEQLAAVTAPARAGGARPWLVNDLAVGFAPDGFDAWSFRDELAPGITVGAPPDPLGPHGQDWGVPAFVPARLAAHAYEPFARTIRAGMAHAGGLRIDHVMGLFRLFWIPEGAEPADGTYVAYPADDLLGVLALESARARALVVGEDLGTVAPGVRERLATEGVLSYRLAWFERGADGRRRRAAAYPRLALAAATTHDLPTVAGFLDGSDLAELRDIGVVAGDGVADAAAQARERASLRRLLRDEGLLDAGEPDTEATTAALHAFLAGTPAMLVAATLEDALGVRRRPNVPGTVTQRPNWSLPLPVPLDELAGDPRLRRLATVLSKGVNRPQSQS
jgi:4-alpha-glucanotransferase